MLPSIGFHFSGRSIPVQGSPFESSLQVDRKATNTHFKPLDKTNEWQEFAWTVGNSKLNSARSYYPDSFGLPDEQPINENLKPACHYIMRQASDDSYQVTIVPPERPLNEGHTIRYNPETLEINQIDIAPSKAVEVINELLQPESSSLK